MIPAHLTNGMIKSDDEGTTKKKAHELAKGHRSRGVYAIVIEDKDEKKHYIFVPVGVTLSLF